MNPFDKYLVIAIAGLCLLLAGSGYLLKRSYVANGAQKSQITALNQSLLRAAEQRAVDQATLDRLAKTNAATARKTALAQASLARSIIANRPWADTPVPKEVQDALR